MQPQQLRLDLGVLHPVEFCRHFLSVHEGLLVREYLLLVVALDPFRFNDFFFLDDLVFVRVDHVNPQVVYQFRSHPVGVCDDLLLPIGSLVVLSGGDLLQNLLEGPFGLLDIVRVVEGKLPWSHVVRGVLDVEAAQLFNVDWAAFGDLEGEDFDHKVSGGRDERDNLTLINNLEGGHSLVMSFQHA